jgi:hypothetical protein
MKSAKRKQKAPTTKSAQKGANADLPLPAGRAKAVKGGGVVSDVGKAVSIASATIGSFFK